MPELARATAAQIVECGRLSHDFWGGGLDLPAYLAREARLRGTPWARDRMVTWVWREGAEILASCETFQVECEVRGERRAAWEVASVFVTAALRGQRHATRMLDTLAARLVSEPNAAAIVLFSDIGPALYEGVGYIARPAWDRVVPSGGTSDVPLVATPRVPRDVPGGTFKITPTADQLRWHLARRPPLGSPCGARRGDDVIVWVADGPWLDVLFLVAATTGGAAALLGAAACAAAAAERFQVRASETLLPGVDWDAIAERVPRKGGLPMIRPLASDVDPEGWTFIPRGVWV